MKFLLLKKSFLYLDIVNVEKLEKVQHYVLV